MGVFMSEFGDLESFDIDKLMRMSEQYAARADELRDRIRLVKGTAASEDERVKVTCTAEGGVEDLFLDPRALRMPAAELAKTIKDLIRDANEDLQNGMNDVIAELMGEDATPRALRDQRNTLQKRAEEAAATHEKMVNDAFGELERMRRDLGL
jgi:DNA-binding protein YbaB